MACKIEKVLTDNGKNSILYQELTKQLPQSTALARYISIKSEEAGYKALYGEDKNGEPSAKAGNDPKFRMAEFNTYQDQVDTMDLLSDMFIEELQNMSGVSDASVIGGFNVSKISGDPRVIPSIIKNIRGRLISSMTGASTYQKDLLRTAAINLPNYIATDERLGELGRKLKDRGINLSIGEQNTLVENMAEEIEESSGASDIEALQVDFERIYDLDVLESSTMMSVLDGVKTYIRSKKRVAKDYKTSSQEPLRFETNIFGHPRPIEYENTMHDMFSVLKGVQSTKEMLGRLESAVNIKPHLLPIYQDLVNEKPIQVDVKGTVISYKPITAALFSTFAKQDYNMFTIAETTDGKILFTPSNRHTVKNKIKTRWEQNAKDISETPIAGRNKTIKAINELLDDKLFNRTITKTKGNSAVLNKLATYFRKAGFDNIDIGVLRELQKTLKENPPKGYEDALFAPTMKNYMRSVVIPVLEGKDIFTNIGDIMAETKQINLLSDLTSQTETDVHLGSFLSGSGAKVHPLNLGSEAQDVFSRLQTNRETIEQFADDPMYTNTKILDALTNEEHRKVFEVSTMDVLNDNNKSGSGVKYGALSTFDALTSRINAYAEGIKHKKYFHAFSPTQADRGKVSALVVPKLDVSDKGAVNKSVFSRTGELVDGEIKDWIKSQIISELTRIQAAQTYKGPKYKNYHGKNALKFNLFTSLNDIFDSTQQIELDQIESIAESLMPEMGSIFKSIIDADAKFLVDNGVLKNTATGFKATNSKSLSDKFVTNGQVETKMLHNYLANNFIYTYEQTLFYAGDPAFYKSKSESDQKVDMNKRMGLPFTPGTKLTVGEATGIAPTSRIKVLNEPTMSSNMAEVYKELFPPSSFKNPNAAAGFYKAIELADGFGVVSISRYKQLMMSRGKHSQEMLNYIQELENWKPGQKAPSADIALEVLKGFYFRLQPSNTGIMTPFNLKYSIMPAIPSFFEQQDLKGNDLYPGMAKISRELRTTTTDEVVMSSAVKVGEVGATNLEGLADATPITIHNESYRFPQDSKSQDKVEDRFGSQMRKLIDANHNPFGILELNGRAMSGDQALANYQASLSEIVNDKGTNVLNQFMDPDTKEIRKDELISSVLNNIESSSFTNVEYFLEALAVENGTTIMPLNYPTIKFKMDSMINSAFKNKVNRLNLPGHSAVQVSSLGMLANEGEFSVGSDLKFVRFQEKKSGRELDKAESNILAKRIKDGEDVSQEYAVMPAEVRVTPKFFKNRLREISDSKVDTKQFDETINTFAKNLRKSNPSMTDSEINRASMTLKKAKLKKAFEDSFKKLKKSVTKYDGTWDVEAFEKAGVTDLVLFRIPTQGKNSMLSAKIKGFLPAEFGGTIQVPAEIVDQAGSDFDIDKVYIEMTNFDMKDGIPSKIEPKYDEDGYVESSSEAELKAYIQEYHKAVLNSTNHVTELLIPNGTIQLNKIVDKFQISDDMYTGSWASLALQETFRSNNKAGKDMISISSVASVAHAVAPLIGTSTVSPVVIAGKTLILGKERNIEGTNRISDEIGEIQNAALDNSKDPILGKLNIDEFTSSAAMLLVAGGHGLEFATSIVNAPIVRALAKTYPKFTRKSNPTIALRNALREVKKSYKLPNKLPKVKLDEYSLEKAEANRIDATNKSSQAEALAAFIEFKELGDKLVVFQTAMNFDSKGTPSTAHGLVKKALDIASVPGTFLHGRETAKVEIAEKSLTVLGKDLKKNPAFKVDPFMYADHSLSQFEKHSIIAPLQVNRKTSPSASVYGQSLINHAIKEIGYLSENQLTTMFAEFDTFLAQNSIANKKSKSGLSRRMATGQFSKLTDPTYGDSTANLIRTYRKSVADSGGTENLFIKSLSIMSLDGRDYVTLSNAVARGMTGDSQREMMFFFEDLMGSENATERKLAKSLADYAISHYGFANSINSFMGVIPPGAHVNYMNSMKGDGKSLTEHFRDIEGTYDEVDNFVDPAVFFDLYVQNNWDKLPIEQVVQREDSGLWSLIPEDERQSAPRYAVLWKRGEKSLHKFSDKQGAYQQMEMRGIRNLVKEYHSGDSLYNSDGSMIKPNTSQGKMKATNEQKGNVVNLHVAADSLKQFAGDILNAPMETYEQANKVAKKLSNLIDKTLGKKTEFTTDLAATADEAQRSYNRAVKKNNLQGRTFQSIFETSLKYELFDSMRSQPFYKDLITKIQNC